MRILFAGATGVLGRAALPHLRDHDVVGLTRSREKLPLLRSLGAAAVVCDVYDGDALLRVVRAVRPEIVVNFVTDLADGSLAANNRARLEGGANIVNTAEDASARRLVVESVAFALQGDAGRAVEELERSASAFPGETLILRFGRLWGPDTAHESRPQPPAIHVDDAGAEAARLLVSAQPGTYLVA